MGINSLFFTGNPYQGSASGTGSLGSRSPGPGNLGPGLGLILKSGTRTQIQNFRNTGLGSALKFKKSGTRDWDRDASKNPGPEPGLTIFSSGTGTQDQKIRDNPEFRDWDRDFDLRDEGFRDSTLGDCPRG